MMTVHRRGVPIFELALGVGVLVLASCGSSGQPQGFNPNNFGAIAQIEHAVPASTWLGEVECPHPVSEVTGTQFTCKAYTRRHRGIPVILEVVGRPSDAGDYGFMSVVAIGLTITQVERCRSTLGVYREDACKVFLWG